MKSSQYWMKPWSIVDGCTHAGSVGCDNCWSMAMNKRFGKWPEKVTPRYDRLDIPLKTKKPTVFAVWNDIAHEEINWGFFGSVIGRIAECPQHTFLMLTKRPERLAGFMTGMCFEWRNLSNLWLGCTIVNQQEADEKIPQLLQVPGHKWLSIEPCLSLILIPKETLSQINAVVIGCETGPHRRPCKLEWIQSIVDQCKAAGVPCFVKQVEVNGKVVHELEDFLDSLRVRRLPWRKEGKEQ